MTDETIATEEAQIPETPEQEQPAQTQEETATQAQSKKDNVIKLLAQKNAEKARADAAEARNKELEAKAAKADELEGIVAKEAVEK